MSLDGIDDPYHEGKHVERVTCRSRAQKPRETRWVRYQCGGPPPRIGQANSKVPPTFVVLAGRARVELGGRSIGVAAGDVVVAPAGRPHMFRAVGSEALEMVNIHAAPRRETAWLEATQP
jgi:mannose-6-phosphate isomerase-like protein (cupin superfamily)